MESASTIDELLAHSAWVRALARSLVADRSTAEDLAQEAMIAALRRPPESGKLSRAWLGGVLRNLAASWRREEQRRAERETFVARHERPVPSTAELASQVEVERRLAREVLRLDEPFRRTLLLRYYRGLSSAEIARRTGTPEGTVRWRLKRGLDSLRARMDQMSGGRAGWVSPLLPALREAAAPAAGAPAGLAPLALLLGRALLVPALATAALLAALALGLGSLGRRALPAEDLALAPGPSAADQALPRALAGPPGKARSTVQAAVEGSVPSEALHAVLEVRARVHGFDGNPLSGARLSAPELPGHPQAESAPDGHVGLALPAELAPPGSMLALALTADGCVERRLSARVRGESALLLGYQELEPAAALHGRAVAGDGTPIAGAEVLIERLPLDDERLRVRPPELRRHLGSQLPDGVPSARTDARGAYRFDALPSGYVRVWARAEGLLAAHTGVHALHPGAALECQDLTLAAPAERERIEGRVLDPGGEPVPFAEVEAVREANADLPFDGEFDAFRARAGPGGRFCLVVSPDAEYLVAARDAQGRSSPSRAMHAVPGARDLTLALRPLLTGVLHVEDGEGVAVADFRAELFDALSGRRVATELDSDPESAALRFELPERPFFVRVQSAGLQAKSFGPFAGDAWKEPLALRLERAARIRGRLLDAGGDAAVPGARLVLLRALPAGEALAFAELCLEPEPFASLVSPAPIASAQTAADGSFAFDAPDPGRYVLRVELDGRERAAHALELPAGEELSELALRLPRSGAIEGRARPGSGRSAAGLVIGIHSGNARLATARTDAAGRFRFDDVPPGRWQVRALTRDISLADEQRVFRRQGERARGALRWDLEVLPGATAQVELDLCPTRKARIEGELSIDGRPPGPWRVELAALDPERQGERYAAALDVHGRFCVAVQGEGLFALRVQHDEPQRPAARVEDRVHARRGGSEWKARFETGELALHAPPGELVSGATYTYVWEGPGELRFFGEIARDGHGGGAPLLVPAGTGRIVRNRFDRAGAGSPTVLELAIEPNRRAEPVLPPAAPRR